MAEKNNTWHGRQEAATASLLSFCIPFRLQTYWLVPLTPRVRLLVLVNPFSHTQNPAKPEEQFSYNLNLYSHALDPNKPRKLHL